MKPELTRRDFVGTSLAAGLALGGLMQKSLGQPAATRTPSPRAGKSGQRANRILYVSDPSSIAQDYLPDPVSEDDLREWVDRLAEAKVDTFVQEAYTQGWTTYWRIDGFEYDARPQHRRFLPLLDAGKQPLEILLDQSHRQGMEFLAGIRINDDHGHVSKSQGVNPGAFFMTNHPQWLLKDFPPGSYYKLSTQMDFSVPQVRDYVFSATEALVGRFDVDGLELCFRDHAYFPYGKGRESQHYMADLVRRVRRMLDEKGRGRGRKLRLGARVYQTVEECQDQGLDVLGWISEGLLDYVAPGDVMYTDWNAPYETFVHVAHASNCQVYPTLLPWSSIRMRRRLGGMPLSLAHYRAAAQNFYGAGADGLSFYNHFVPLQWAPFYPAMLQEIAELKDRQRLAQGNRHYLFEPIWAGCTGFGRDGLTCTGALKSDRIVLTRSAPGASGRYRLRMCEDFSHVQAASLLFRSYPTTSLDKLEVRLNGTLISPAKQKRRTDERRLDQAAPVDIHAHLATGESPVPDVPQPPILTTWFDLAGPPAIHGDNWLEVTLSKSDPAISGDLIIDEIEVFIEPKLG